MFERWGRFVYRWRWIVLALSTVLLGVSIAGVISGGPSVTSGGTSVAPP